MTRALLLLGLAALPLLPTTAHAGAVVERLSVRSFGDEAADGVIAGLGRHYPLFVDLSYRGPAARGRLVARNERTQMRWSVPVDLSPRARLRQTITCFQRKDGLEQVQVELVVPGVTVAGGKARVRVRAGGDEVVRVLFLGTDALPRAFAARTLERVTGTPFVTVRHPPGAPLPERAEGFEPFSIIVVGQYPLADIEPAAAAALERWVALGGELWYLADGLDPRARIGPAFTPLMPVQVRREWLFTDRGPVARLTGARDGPAPAHRAAGGELVDGATSLAAHDGLSLIAWRPHGAGKIGYCGLDLTREPWIGWPARDRLWLAMLSAHTPRTTAETLGGVIGTWLRHDPPRPFVGWGAILLAAYVVLLAAGGSLLARQWRARRQAVWILPAIGLIGAIGALAVALGASRVGTSWRSVRVATQRSGQTLTAETVIALAATPAATPTRVGFEGDPLPALVLGVRDSDRSHCVQGERPHLSGVVFFLGRAAAVQVRQVAERPAIHGHATVQMDKSGTGSRLLASGRVRGVSGTPRAIALWGGRATTVFTLETTDDGQLRIPANVELDHDPSTAIAGLVDTLPIDPDDRVAPDQLPLPPRHDPVLDLVFFEQTDAPLTPRGDWTSERHLALRVLRLPVKRAPALTVVARASSLDEQVFAEEKKDNDPEDNYKRTEVTMRWRLGLRPDELGAGRRRLVFRIHHGVSGYAEGRYDRLVFAVRDQRTGEWRPVKGTPVSEGSWSWEWVLEDGPWIGPWGRVEARLGVPDPDEDTETWFELGDRIDGRNSTELTVEIRDR